MKSHERHQELPKPDFINNKILMKYALREQWLHYRKKHNFHVFASWCKAELEMEWSRRLVVKYFRMWLALQTCSVRLLVIQMGGTSLFLLRWVEIPSIGVSTFVSANSGYLKTHKTFNAHRSVHSSIHSLISVKKYLDDIYLT